MATVTPAVSTKGASGRITVTWAGIVTGDTVDAHITTQSPDRISVHGYGTFANGTSVAMLGSNDGTNFLDCVDGTGTALEGKLAAFLIPCSTIALEYKPEVTLGSSDSITVVMVYKT